ncbi:proto-oncogene tyrosine-protein kinase ROS-like [Tubulanus polymorphus]|uniref:proto-oncogene tyrosine-protein kinase ROS-like n=1 Tax=Tubulanus polymorphus TaxID=672921 RepID=UPI003DA3F200
MCNDTEFAYNKDQYCVTGCNAALDIYTEDILEAFGKLPPPVLAASSLTNTSLGLRWSGKMLHNVSYILQWKYTNISPSEWQVYGRINSGRVTVKYLRPYTRYQFRIVAKITSRHMVETPATIPILTKASGPPSTEPVILSISSPSSSVIHLSWKPPRFTNGPLTGYRLCLRPLNNSLDGELLKEVSASLTAYTFSNLQNNTAYEVSLLAWNSEGRGPDAKAEVVTQKTAGIVAVPYMILGADSMILKKDIRDVLTYSKTMYDGPENVLIFGVAVHTGKNIIFFSDSAGNIHRLFLDQENMQQVVYHSYNVPSALSVDWLNDRVYMVEGHTIKHCDLEYQECQKVIVNLYPPADDVKADPYNGYLYWTQNGKQKGIYRTDLKRFSRTVIRNPSLYRIVEIDRLSTLFIDYQNYRLYFPNGTKNTIMSTSLDGSDLIDIRTNAQRKDFVTVKSLVYYDGKFVWTNGDFLGKEEYDPLNNMYHHTQVYLRREKYFCGLTLYHPSAQPIPVPANPPVAVQALFTDNSCIVSWRKPPLLKEKGKEAWQRWVYEIALRDEMNITRTVNRVRRMRYRIYHLKHNTKYHIKVRGYTEGGYGPWSTEFTGLTLPYQPVHPRILAANEDSIIQADIDGSNQIPIVNFERDDVKAKITDIHMYKGMYIWSMDNGRIYKYHKNDSQLSDVPHIHDATSIVIDWLSGKIYWSNVKQSMIFRSDLSGNSIETVYQASAQDMAIDSMAGYLYWTTTHTVECSILNGAGHYTYKTLPFLSEKFMYILGLTLDLQDEQLYWIVKSYEGALLYTAPMNSGRAAKTNSQVKQIGTLKAVSRMPMLHYYSNRLFWLNGEDEAVISDETGSNPAAIKFRSKTVRTMTVIHPSLQPYPEGHTWKTVTVVPGDIPATSLDVKGNWSDFNIIWPLESTVNHGDVYYEVSLQYGVVQKVIITDKPAYNIKNLKPFTTITVSLRAYTHWGSSKTTSSKLKSPMSEPSIPLNPRAFVSFNQKFAKSEPTVHIEFRWNCPAELNGVLNGFHVFYQKSDGIWERQMLGPHINHFQLNNVDKNSIYSFQVDACSHVGCSNKTKPVSLNASEPRPIPQILVAQNDTLLKLDVDEKTGTPIVRAKPLSVAYLAADHLYFWLNAEKQIMKYDGTSKVEIYHLGDEEAHGLTVDWIGRALYWLARQPDGTTTIMLHSIDRKDKHGLKLFNRTNPVSDLNIDPYRSTLYWTEQFDNDIKLITSSLNGENVTELIKPIVRQKRDVNMCSCSALKLGPQFTVDHSNAEEVSLYVIDRDTHYIYKTDLTACNCKLIFKGGRTVDEPGLPPDDMTVDSSRLYWSNQKLGVVNSVDKNTGKNFFPERLDEVLEIVAFGPHLQPLPDLSCLMPGDQTEKAQYAGSTNTSISLLLQPPDYIPKCNKISRSPTKYRVHYRRVDENETLSKCAVSVGCSVQEDFKTNIVVGGLEPYSKYVFQVSNENFYSAGLPPVFGPPVEYHTKEGIPSQPLNVQARVCTPDMIGISWDPPSRLNGDESDILYYIQWQMKGKLVTMTTNEQYSRPLKRPNACLRHNFKMGMLLRKMADNTRYSFWVLARNRKMDKIHHSTSREVTVKTYEYPGPLHLLHRGRRQMTMQWTSPSDGSAIRHMIVAREKNRQRSRGRQGYKLDMTTPDTVYNITVHDLKPDTLYIFIVRVVLLSKRSFIWPLDDRYMFRTLPDAPERPHPPSIKSIGDNKFEILWDEPEDGGRVIQRYVLQYMHLTGDNLDWVTVYNGTERKWLVDGLAPNEEFTFHVAAVNEIGWSEYSINSSVFYLDQAVSAGMDPLTVILAGSFTALMILIIIIASVLVSFFRKRNRMKKIPVSFIVTSNGTDVELANLRELPAISVQQTNTLYAIGIVPSEEEIAKLPHFRRDQLTLTKFLGSGAFGEVFEGCATNILGDSTGETKVAVKTLRKGASAVEKDEFLKEALLMSNFKHEHILRLLGVCLENDPQFIILELMQGGDLLSFLRVSRPTLNCAPLLTLPDLISISVDVARGCEYLEEMHFVHRDLAARNCLVAPAAGGSRLLVKIGDFGLARDIYKNDYYRKEGEGLLPVRWMSPESLMDGVFTTQSDVWAFGVLVWEVMTLGQQPYPARTNIEVLHFVRNGGRLDKPEGCPSDLYSLMLQCWCYCPDDRPSFCYLRQQLQQLSDKAAEFSEALLIGRLMTGGFDNLAFDTLEAQSSRKKKYPNKLCVNLSPRSKKKLAVHIPDSMKILTRRKHKLRTLFGCYDDSVVPQSPVGDEYLTARHGRMKRALSFDSNQFNMAKAQEEAECIRLDALGYLRPNQGEMPKYLELIADPTAAPAQTGLDNATDSDNDDSVSTRMGHEMTPPLSADSLTRSRKSAERVVVVDQEIIPRELQGSESVISHPLSSSDSQTTIGPSPVNRQDSVRKKHPPTRLNGLIANIDPTQTKSNKDIKSENDETSDSMCLTQLEDISSPEIIHHKRKRSYTPLPTSDLDSSISSDDAEDEEEDDEYDPLSGSTQSCGQSAGRKITGTINYAQLALNSESDSECDTLGRRRSQKRSRHSRSSRHATNGNTPRLSRPQRLDYKNNRRLNEVDYECTGLHVGGNSYTRMPVMGTRISPGHTPRRKGDYMNIRHGEESELKPDVPCVRI